MRNLKKILALVLALVMSLSLMATAGAADFTDASDINEKYETAIEVLEGLGVFKGYQDGTFQPTGSITRAETAAIIYRIVTGDVKDEQVGIYADYNLFTDVPSTSWFAGYVNYCANAEYIKGVGGGKFEPNSQVTGYAALAMILRAIGYTANGGFTGSDWEVQTARTAEARKITKNILTGTLGQPATRETVAEILFQAILVNMVDHNVDNTFNGNQGYSEIDMTLGYKTFKLEEVTGVVVANEYADLRYDDTDRSVGTTPAAAGTTVLRDAEGKDRIVNVASTLEDLGESRLAYTTENGKRDSYDLKCLALGDSGMNSIAYDGGEAKANLNGLVSGNEAEHFVNFGRTTGNATTTIKVSYRAGQIAETISARTQADAISIFRNRYHLSATAQVTANQSSTYVGSGLYDVTYNVNNSITANLSANAAYNFRNDVNTASWPAGHNYSIQYDTVRQIYYYYVQIEPGAVFNADDVRVVEAIFNRADLRPATVNVARIIDGEVYRGTQSTVDYSDTRSYEQFRLDCIKEPEDNTSVTGNSKGWWLKIIDNDADGITDYILQTRYTVATAASVSEEGVPTLETEGTWTGNDAVNQLSRASSTANEGDALAAGDVVYYAVIDGVARVWKAEVADVRVDTINRNDLTITTADGTSYEESAVHEHSALPTINSFVRNMSGKTNYSLYLDKFGYLAAFSQNAAGKFVLLTDGWSRSALNGAEYTARTWDSENQAFANVNITSGGNLFINAPGANFNGWNGIRAFAPMNAGGATNDIQTIVAYMENDGENGTLIPVDTVYDVLNQNSRMVEMLDLGTTIPTQNTSAPAGTVYQTTFMSPGTVYGSRTPAVNTDPQPIEVRALSNTMYYYVYDTNGGSVAEGHTDSTITVRQFQGYTAGASFLTTAERARYVEDVYVVGTRATHVTATGAPGVPYYTANVVVVELNDQFYAEHNDIEEVFIYDFPEVSNRVTVENVKAINANGELVDLKVDLSLSTYRLYDWGSDKDGGNTLLTRRMPAPGLYHLHRTSRTDSEGIYSISLMDHEDIRRSGSYDVGTVVRSFATLGDNYAQVNDWACGNLALEVTPDGAHFETSPNRNVAPLPLASSAARQRTDNSKFYFLSYGTGNNAGYSANLSQPGHNVVMAEQFGNLADGNANQVLVRFNGSGQIVYAISFDHLNGSAENYAQQVWRSQLLDADKRTEDPTTLSISFYGVPVTGATTNVSYSTAFDNRNNPLVVTGGTFSISGGTPAITNVAGIAPNAATKQSYTLDVISNGVASQYTLNQLPIQNAGRFIAWTNGTPAGESPYYTAGNLINSNDGAGATGAANEGRDLSLKGYINTFTLVPPSGLADTDAQEVCLKNSTVRWTFKLAETTTNIVIDTRWDENGKAISWTPASGRDDDLNVNMSTISDITAVVTGENTSSVNRYKNATAAAATEVTFTHLGITAMVDNASHTSGSNAEIGASVTYSVAGKQYINFVVSYNDGTAKTLTLPGVYDAATDTTKATGTVPAYATTVTTAARPLTDDEKAEFEGGTTPGGVGGGDAGKPDGGADYDAAYDAFKVEFDRSQAGKVVATITRGTLKEINDNILAYQGVLKTLVANGTPKNGTNKLWVGVHVDVPEGAQSAKVNYSPTKCEGAALTALMATGTALNRGEGDFTDTGVNSWLQIGTAEYDNSTGKFTSVTLGENVTEYLYVDFYSTAKGAQTAGSKIGDTYELLTEVKFVTVSQ